MRSAATVVSARLPRMNQATGTDLHSATNVLASVGRTAMRGTAMLSTVGPARALTRCIPMRHPPNSPRCLECRF